MNRLPALLSFLVVLLVASTTFAGGYKTELDIYLDMDAWTTNDLRFDYSSAINQPDYDDDGLCDHRRDFIMTCGFYNDSDATGSGPRFVCSASNNAPGWPKNPGRAPFTITDEGWYTFRHTFYDGGAGVLAVDMEILDDTGASLNVWTLTTATDVIDVTVGGNRYGWLVTSDFDYLAMDESKKCTDFGCDFDQGFEVDVDDWSTVTRVPSGTHGIGSSDGAFHVEAAATDFGSPDGFVFTRWGGYTCDFGSGALEIDLRPNSTKNQINTGARQLVPVAILGSELFDPCATVDEDSIRARGASTSRMGVCEDANADGWDDYVVYFRARSLDPPTPEECDDPNAIFVLTGSSLDGDEFAGIDSVIWLNCK